MSTIQNIITDQNTEALALARRQWKAAGAKPGHLITFLRPTRQRVTSKLHFRMYLLSK